MPLRDSRVMKHVSRFSVFSRNSPPCKLNCNSYPIGAGQIRQEKTSSMLWLAI